MLINHLRDENSLKWMLASMLGLLLAFIGVYLGNPNWTPLALLHTQHWQMDAGYGGAENWLFVALVLMPLAVAKTLRWIGEGSPSIDAANAGNQ